MHAVRKEKNRANAPDPHGRISDLGAVCILFPISSGRLRLCDLFDAREGPRAESGRKTRLAGTLFLSSLPAPPPHHVTLWYLHPLRACSAARTDTWFGALATYLGKGTSPEKPRSHFHVEVILVQPKFVHTT